MLTKNRLEAFSDGVFAIAITLLVIEIRPPDLAEGESLASGLWDQWPSYLGYLLSFLVLGVMWLQPSPHLRAGPHASTASSSCSTSTCCCGRC